MVNLNEIKMPTALPVLMFQIELLRVYCSYSHAYIILLEAETEIHASYVNNLYDRSNKDSSFKFK